MLRKLSFIGNFFLCTYHGQECSIDLNLQSHHSRCLIMWTIYQFIAVNRQAILPGCLPFKDNCETAVLLQRSLNYSWNLLLPFFSRISLGLLLPHFDYWWQKPWNNGYCFSTSCFLYFVWFLFFQLTLAIHFRNISWGTSSWNCVNKVVVRQIKVD